MKELMKLLSNESVVDDTVTAEEPIKAVETVAEQVLDEGTLLDGTPVDDDKESAIGEMLDHAERARQMADQLSELADKADEILEEDKQHLITEISTEVMQMNYRHIMQNAGLADALVSFESSNKATELNYLSNEARKMANVAMQLENRILDFSPEGKIWSFLRADSKQIAVARGDIETYAEKIGRGSKEMNANKIPLEWGFFENSKEWLVFKDGKAVGDLTQAIIDDLDLCVKSFQTINNNNKIIRQIVGDLKAGKELDKNKLKQLKQPEIVGKHVLGDKMVKADQGEWGRIFGWTPANPPVWLTGLSMVALTPIFAITFIVASQKINLKNAMDKAGTFIDPGKLKKMTESFREAAKILDRDEHADFDTKSIKEEIPAEYRSTLLTMAKQSAKLQGFLYEHIFFLNFHTAKTLRSTQGAWTSIMGNVAV